VLAVIVTVLVMLLVVFAPRLATVQGFTWLAPVSRLAWPWYVPLGTLIAVGIGVVSSLRRSRPA
jgi:hypothetical protein